jgi:hypothetical protein
MATEVRFLLDVPTRMAIKRYQFHAHRLTTLLEEIVLMMEAIRTYDSSACYNESRMVGLL